MTSLFVTGTDTEVGKTRISVALIEKLKQQGKTVAGMKPVASGCEVTAEGLRNEDALALQEQANVDLSYDLVNPYAFEPAIAPHIAAQLADVDIDVTLLQKRFYEIQAQAESVVVEGAGGWFVPLDDKLTLADLAVRLGLPVVVVVGIRLGCINHALLTLAAIKQSGLPIYGWVANHCLEAKRSETDEIITSLKQRISEPCLGVVPYLSEGDKAWDYINL
jgi:dethiobiotin synthetase